jgi:hypothetical protein
MGMKSLRSGLLLLRNPCLWIAPFICAIFGYLQISSAFGESGAFLSEKIGFIWLLAIPFFLAATYGCVKNDDYSIRSYLKTGASGYFRVLIPGVLLFLVAVILIVLAFVPLMSGGGELLPFIIIVVMFVPFVLLTFFYDTAAIFEDKKVFESIKRSLELNGIKTAEVISFYAVALLLLIIIGFGLMILWSGLLTDQLMPLVDMTETELNQIATDPEAFMGIIGDYGILVTSLIYAFGIFISVLVLLPYKAAFYRDVLLNAVPVEIGSAGGVEGVGMGEYDEKGRWYKYS